MTLQELKRQIENGCVTDTPIIFKDDSEAFLSRQYVKEISKVRQKKINYIQDLSDTYDPWSFFTDITEKTTSDLDVLFKEVYSWGTEEITRATNLIVVVTKFADKSIEASLKDYIITMPKLEGWQIKDYVYSICEGVDKKQLDWLIDLCGNNISRLQQELDKITLFTESERKYIFDSFVRDGSMDDLSSFNIFNFTNAIASKNLSTLKSIYKEIDRVDITDFYLLTVLLKTFRNIIMVQLNSNPTPETTGLDSKQLYAIKKIPRAYSSEQLVKVFEFLCDIDRQIKEGELPTSLVVDYLTLKVLSM